MKNRNGFTLIELLAVIIILGILMIIAIPSVTKYINDSRKSAYVDTAKEIIGGARNLVNEGKLGMYDTSATYYIPAKYIKTEGGEPKSPYGKLDEAYVAVTYDGKEYDYYWTSRDETGQGMDKIIKNSDLDEDNIVSDINDEYVENLVKKSTLGCRKNIKILNENGKWDDYLAANYIIDDDIFNIEYMCPNCKFLRSTSEILKEGKKLNLSTVEDYKELNNYENSPFLGVELEGNIIKKIYSCGVYNNKVLCLDNNPNNFECDNAKIAKFFDIDYPLFADSSESTNDNGTCKYNYYTLNNANQTSDHAFSCVAQGISISNNIYCQTYFIYEGGKICYVAKRYPGDTTDNVNFGLCHES